jgi:hypothetical protein
MWTVVQLNLKNKNKNNNRQDKREKKRREEKKRKLGKRKETKRKGKTRKSKEKTQKQIRKENNIKNNTAEMPKSNKLFQLICYQLQNFTIGLSAKFVDLFSKLTKSTMKQSVKK